MKPMTRILLLLMVILGALIAKSVLGANASQVVKVDKEQTFHYAKK